MSPAQRRQRRDAARPSRLGGALLCAALALAAALPAAAATTAWVGDGHAAVRLVTATDGRGTAPLAAGLAFRFAPGWHGYWRTPGDAGLPPAVDWSGTPGLDMADVAWPAPTRLVVAGFQNAVYAGSVLLPVTLSFSHPATPAAATVLRAAVDYAACSNVCVPLHADLVLPLPGAGATPAPEASLIVAARAALPADPAAAGFLVRRENLVGAGDQRRLVVEVASPSVRLVGPDLFVEGFGDGLPAAPAVALAEDGHAATLTVALPEPAAGRPLGPTPLGLTLVDGPRSAAFAGPAAAAAAPIPEAEPAGGGFGRALLAALLGGLILNLMPCVLPVLALKVVGVASRAGLVATGLGIVASFLLLAAVLVGLKLSGAAVGWGIQFQQPLFLAVMAIVTVLFAASLFDWVHVGVPAGLARLGERRPRHALMQSFLAGAFATLLATPCSAPFVGTAVGFALARGPAEVLAIFLGLGLGMALPLFAVASAPRLAGWLPRPGPWMIGLRRVLGLLLLATAAWLVAVLAGVAGAGAAGTAAGTLALMLGLLGWAARSAPGRRWPAAVALGLGAAALATVAVLPRPAAAPDGDTAFDPDAIATIVGRGGTVLVDVSAAWCLTCKVNDAAALGSAAVRARLARPGTVVMRADWTRPDPGIARYIQGFGRFGIPLDVVYGPGRTAGELLPELLTPATVLAALDRAAGGS